MGVIIKNALRERIRRKELYIVVAIGMLLMLLCSSDTASLSIDGEPVTGFKNMFMVMHILVNAVGCILAVVLSVRTIPNEYERQNSHLVWVRGISQTKYHAGLSIANILSTMSAVAILYIVLAVYVISNGKLEYCLLMIPAFLIESINIVIISLFTSVCSIFMPAMATGTCGILLAGCGVFYGLLDLYKNIIGGFGGKLISLILSIVPDMNGIQKQAQNLMTGNKVDIHLVLTSLFAIYVISLGIFIFKKKEA